MARPTVAGMDTRDLFLRSDAALRSVIDRIQPAQLDRPAPAAWSRRPNPTLRDILAYHAFDEAWVPDVIAGRTAEEVGDRWDGDLLGDDPIAGYDRLNDAATAAATADYDPSATVHFSYGDYPLGEGFVHLAVYRAFQAWSIAHLLGIDFRLPETVVSGMNEHVTSHIDEWRAMGVFPPEIEPPAGADPQTLLLCKVGYWEP